MTEREFIKWLEGYVEGRLIMEPKYSYTQELLKTIKNKIKEIEDNRDTLLLDSENPNSNFA